MWKPSLAIVHVRRPAMSVASVALRNFLNSDRVMLSHPLGVING
jgi:hypothetical protein